MHRQDVSEITDNLTEHTEDFRSKAADRIASRVDDLRDRAASAMGDQTREELRRLRREVMRLNERTDDLSTLVDEWLEQIDDRLETYTERMTERVRDEIDSLDSTSWFTRLFWMSVGAGAGYAAAYLLDPQQGTRRRHMLRDQVEARSRDLADDARKQADYVAGQAKGSVIEGAKKASPIDLDAPEDPKTLRQKIRSDVIGSIDGSEAVVVAVHSDGRVTLKGEVESPSTEQRLIHETSQVAGVSEVTSELTVRASR